MPRARRRMKLRSAFDFQLTQLAQNGSVDELCRQRLTVQLPGMFKKFPQRHLANHIGDVAPRADVGAPAKGGFEGVATLDDVAVRICESLGGTVPHGPQ